jgi:hypothetical protein
MLKLSMDHEKLNVESFDYWGNNASIWKRKAIDLFLASEVIFANLAKMPFNADQGEDQDHLKYSGTLNPAIMLQGYAIEVALKAFWISKGNKVAKNGEYSFIKPDNHNLVKIADAAKFDLIGAEKDILQRLSVFVKAYGRYPITKKALDAPNQGLPWNLDEDGEVVKNLFERIIQNLEKNLPDNSESVSI